MNNIIGIFGKGGFARELKYHIIKKYKKNIKIDFLSDIIDKNNNNYIDINNIDIKIYNILLATGDPNLRNELYNKYKGLNYINYIHDYNNLLDPENIIIGDGTIICAGSVLTTNIKLGLCNHINLNSTIGHDTELGNFVTCSPGANISGNCKIGNNVLIGTNSAIREHIKICDNVIIGMNSNVIKNINEPGTYVGNPLKKLN
jgi:sugar O-acyltransferase (sialic acid O-acetyltransferase NeuD family)